jgi:hypothetical protein
MGLHDTHRLEDRRKVRVVMIKAPTGWRIVFGSTISPWVLWSVSGGFILMHDVHTAPDTLYRSARDALGELAMLNNGQMEIMNEPAPPIWRLPPPRRFSDKSFK